MISIVKYEYLTSLMGKLARYFIINDEKKLANLFGNYAISIFYIFYDIFPYMTIIIIFNFM